MILAISIGATVYTLQPSCHTFLCKLPVPCHNPICIGLFHLLRPMHKVGLSVFFAHLDTNGIIENVRNGAAFRCVEAVGQAIAYSMNTQTSNILVGL
jgi:hypothetical protein